MGGRSSGEATISVFTFQEANLVLLGGGSCAAQAKVDAERANCIIVPMPSFDPAAAPLPLDTLRRVASRKVFLAGSIGADDIKGFFAIDELAYSKHPRSYIRSTLAKALENAYAFPISLHDVVGPVDELEVLGGDIPSQETLDRVEELHEQCLLKTADGERPGRDRINDNRRDTVLNPQRNGNCVILQRRSCAPFDTAFVDADMIKQYFDRGIRLIAVAGDVIVLEAERLRLLSEETKGSILRMRLSDLNRTCLK